MKKKYEKKKINEVQPVWKRISQYLLMLNMSVSYDPAISRLAVTQQVEVEGGEMWACVCVRGGDGVWVSIFTKRHVQEGL